MYGIGQRVMYGIHGVCLVADTEEQVLDGKRVTYLVLTPLSQPGSRFLIPTHNAAAMGKLHPMLTREELEALLDSEAVRADAWIPEENQRKQTYRELIVSGNRQALLAMVRTLWQHKQAQTRAGRKAHLCDDNFLRDAQKLLADEVAAVLEVTPEEATRYLHQRLEV